MMASGICVSLGCDGHNCSNHLDMGVAIYLAAGLYKDNRMDVSLVPAEKAIEMGTVDAAKGMRMDARIGSLEAGKKADIVLIDMSRPEWHPLVNPVTSFVYGLGTRGVDTVMIDGRIVLDRGRLTRIDEAVLHKRVQRLSDEVIRRTGLPTMQRWKLV
jgi:5-methylthioadenosine/S-adenosylhomocysteine deaminase